MDTFENQIVQLEGVISANISLKESGEIDEIHVIADKSRNPKNIVRDIETLFHVNLNQEIDHKKISIAQLNINDGTTSSQQRIEIVSIYKKYNRPICDIELQLGGMKFQKRFEGNIQDTTPRLVAEAMIDAIKGILPKNIYLEIKNIFFCGLNNEILIVELYWITNIDGFIKRDPLIGSVYVKDELTRSTGQAFLNAINRKIDILFNN